MEKQPYSRLRQIETAIVENEQPDKTVAVVRIVISILALVGGIILLIFNPSDTATQAGIALVSAVIGHYLP